MRTLSLFCCLFLANVLFNACEQKSGSFENAAASDSPAPKTEESRLAEAAPPPPPAPSTPDPAKPDEALKFEPKLIKIGNLEFQTADLGSTYQRIVEACKTNGGFLSNESTVNDYDRVVQSLTIRVPSRNFDKLVDAVCKGVEHFDTKNIEAQDVTEEFVDAEARLKTKKQVELRYQELLKRANKISEILEIERQIGDLRAEIEAIEGRLRYLSNRVDYSTLNISFYKKTPEYRVVEENRFGRAFRNGWDGLVGLILGLTSIWPFLIILGVVGFFVRRWWKGQKK